MESDYQQPETLSSTAASRTLGPWHEPLAVHTALPVGADFGGMQQYGNPQPQSFGPYGSHPESIRWSMSLLRARIVHGRQIHGSPQWKAIVPDSHQYRRSLPLCGSPPPSSTVLSDGRFVIIICWCLARVVLPYMTDLYRKDRYVPLPFETRHCVQYMCEVQ